MGNINSQTGHINGSRFEAFRPEHQPVRSYPKPRSQIKVLPDPESRQRLKQTYNGDILFSGGTLSKHHVPYRSVSSKPYSPTQRYSFHKNESKSSAAQNRNYASSQHVLNSYKSEPDLRHPYSMAREMKERRPKKKYKAPPPPNNKREEKSEDNWDVDGSDECTPRRVRLFKTRVETKKESSQASALEQVIESNSDIVEEKIQIRQNHVNYMHPNRLSLPEFTSVESVDFKSELKQATERLREITLNANDESRNDNLENRIFDQTNEAMQPKISSIERCQDMDKHIRGEPSGKESSTPELSPVLKPPEHQKPRAFYFGMEREDSDASSNCHVEEDDSSTIALRLRPVLPRKPPQMPHFSPAAAWRLLDARSQDSGISGDARPPLSSSWTPQQDLGDDSSSEEVRRELPKSLSRHRPHIFSLSLPRDLQPAAFTTISSNKTGVSSLRRLKRSVSGVLNTLSAKKEAADHRGFFRDQEDTNWFLSRSAPNSINENSADVLEIPFTHSTSRLMYLPENPTKMAPNEPDNKYHLSAFSKSCEELKMPESLRDPKSVYESMWSKAEPSRKQRKFTFQSTVRQIERRRMAEKLSREAEKKERQRLREVEAMRRVEEEFQKKRAKEKANIRQQLRLYAMDESQWTSLPFEPNNMKLEERQEPEGALSSSASSPVPLYKYDPGHSLESKRATPTTQELSEYRQVQRDYKEYRGAKFVAENRTFKQTTVYPEVTYNMPNAKGSNCERGNYRKDFAYGIKSSKSVDSNQSEDSPKMYRSRYSPITRF